MLMVCLYCQSKLVWFRLSYFTKQQVFRQMYRSDLNPLTEPHLRNCHRSISCFCYISCLQESFLFHQQPKIRLLDAKTSIRTIPICCFCFVFPFPVISIWESHSTGASRRTGSATAESRGLPLQPGFLRKILPFWQWCRKRRRRAPAWYVYLCAQPYVHNLICLRFMKQWRGNFHAAFVSSFADCWRNRCKADRLGSGSVPELQTVGVSLVPIWPRQGEF